MDLHIMDTSNYIYAGSFSKKFISRGVRETNGEYCANEAPIGGVLFLLRQVRALTDNDTIVMPVFDRTPDYKRGMYEAAFGNPYGYKGKRPAKSVDISFQKEYAEQILRELGYPVQAADGYEADDVIYSVVKYFRDDFDHIYIHTRDSDLTFLVDDKVSIATVGNVGKTINMMNYTSVAHKSGWCAYNTVHMRKLFEGDVSDNIPGIGERWAELMDACIEDKADLKKFGDLDLARKYIKKAVVANPTEPGAHTILSTFNIVCPLLVPEGEIDDSDMCVDFEKFAYFLGQWNPSLDRWHFEDQLSDYIDQYYE